MVDRVNPKLLNIVLPGLGACLVAYTLTPGHGSHQTMPRWARTSDSFECLN